ncbi:MAG: PAS domain S-box protein [Deltaproteobacteria bacterium]|nr:PAS domain S-box protein [Deltaproteobacteria bacterium]
MSRESIRPPPDGTWLRAVLDAMVEAVLVVDADGRIALTNRALDAMTSEDVRGRRAKNVIKNERLREAMRDARKKRRATEVELEASVRGRARIFHALVSPLPKRAGAVAVLRDVTPIKDLERLRRDFVANASHELRTPLTSIRGFAETLVDGAVADPAATHRFLEAILRQTKRLQRLAEDLAVLARAESTDEPLAANVFDLRTIAAHVATALGPRADELGVKLRVSTPRRAVRTEANASAVEQVLTNLVDNALKHSKRGGRVVIAVQGAVTLARVEVRDTGRGIAAQHHARIFERFYRVDAGRTRSDGGAAVGGTGLGLAIVKHLVERMRGSVSVESAIGKGATFRVELPRPSR